MEAPDFHCRLLLFRFGLRYLARSLRPALRFRLSALCSKHVVEDVAASEGMFLGSLNRKSAPQTEHGRSQTTMTIGFPLDVTVSISPTLSNCLSFPRGSPWAAP
jgi:hypothetical protein